jgi:hypothetical protein
LPLKRREKTKQPTNIELEKEQHFSSEINLNHGKHLHIAGNRLYRVYVTVVGSLKN